MRLHPFVLCIAFACTRSVPSTDVHTSAVYAEWIIEQHSVTSVTANATFHVGSADGADLVLTSPDHVACNGVALEGPSSIPIAKSYTFDLARSGEMYSATLPPPPAFTLTGPSLAGTYDDQYTLRWTGDALGQARVDISATSTQESCVGSPIATDAPDTGSFAFDGSAFGASRSVSPPSCAYTITVTRKRSVPLPSGFAGGEVTSRFVQTIAAQVHP